ncbi:MAG TPA: Stk1 family PASTA domain-containing Ser/Thr kinase [Solirubrobacteraceae bacterium]|nr:Stk1 family PASTA domain-containing Ser/Thr kinase [Solirubrobacteraceae bacterium]
MDLASDIVVDGRYRLLERVGSGGMAEVWSAQDLQLGRKVALKLLHRRFSEDPEFVERFHREASSAAGLQHPNVVSVYDRGEWDGTYYIAMEFLEGRSLKQVVSTDAPMDPVAAIDIVIGILRAARFAHKRGIIHRDLKPPNVILDEEGRVKVTDFGIARAGASDITETGSIMGTAQYLAPEQAQGRAVSASADIYAIGVVLYELTTGRVPFEGDSAVTIALKHVAEAPVPPAAINPAMAPELSDTILRALEKDPSQRFPDADAFIAQLEHVRGQILAGVAVGQDTASFALPVSDPHEPLAGDPLVPYEPAAPGSRTPWWWAVVVVALIAGAGFAAYTLTRPVKTAVPNVIGLDVSHAQTLLTSRGFKLAPPVRQANPAPKDTVVGQAPTGGTKIDKSKPVTLSVSDGPAQLPVPNVRGQAEADAKRALMRAGFQVKARKGFSAKVAAGLVAKTDPPVGTQVPRSSLVTLVISKGAGTVAVPDVTGNTQAAATATLTQKGFKVAASSQESPDKPSGTVLSQSPAGGGKATRGSTVRLKLAIQPKRVTVPTVVGSTDVDAEKTLSDAGLTPVIVEHAVSDSSQDGKVLAQAPHGGKAKRGARVRLTVGRLPTNPPPGGGAPPAQ